MGWVKSMVARQRGSVNDRVLFALALAAVIGGRASAAPLIDELAWAYAISSPAPAATPKVDDGTKYTLPLSGDIGPG